MKAAVGDLVYVPPLDAYGFVHTVRSDGRIVFVKRLDFSTGETDIVDVVDLVVEAVGIIKRLIVILRIIFSRFGNDN